MARETKVWGVLIVDSRFGNSQSRAIVTARSRAEAARAFGISDSYLKGYGSDTGNALEIAIANSKPGTVFVCPSSSWGGYQWEERDTRAQVTFKTCDSCFGSGKIVGTRNVH